jgi:hypothetical protein
MVAIRPWVKPYHCSIPSKSLGWIHLSEQVDSILQLLDGLRQLFRQRCLLERLWGGLQPAFILGYHGLENRDALRQSGGSSRWSALGLGWTWSGPARLESGGHTLAVSLLTLGVTLVGPWSSHPGVASFS